VPAVDNKQPMRSWSQPHDLFYNSVATVLSSEWMKHITANLVCRFVIALSTCLVYYTQKGRCDIVILQIASAHNIALQSMQTTLSYLLQSSLPLYPLILHSLSTITDVNSWFCSAGLCLNAGKSEATMFEAHQCLCSLHSVARVNTASSTVCFSDQVMYGLLDGVVSDGLEGSFQMLFSFSCLAVDQISPDTECYMVLLQ